MGETAKNLNDAINNMGGGPTGFKRKGFTSEIEKKPNVEPIQKKKAAQVKETQKPFKQVVEKKQPEIIREEANEDKEERITVVLRNKQSANYINIAAGLHSKSDKKKRERKISRDMVIRAVLSIGEEIPWNGAGELNSEEQIVKFIKSHISIK